MRSFGFILTTFILLTSLGGYAQIKSDLCSITKGQQYFFYLKPESGEQGAFSIGRDQIPPVVINNCKKAAGQYLGLAFGLNYPSLSSESTDITIDGHWNTEVCKIESEDIPQFQFRKEKSPTFDGQFDLFRACLNLEVTSLNQFPLQIKETQKFCKVKKTGPNRYQLDGEFCYLKIHPEMSVAVSMLFKPECLNGNYFKDKGSKFTDLESTLQAFVVEKDDGEVVNNAIGASNARFSFLPAGQLSGEAQFPAEAHMDVHMGNIRWQDVGGQQSGQRSIIDTFALVNNISKEAKLGSKLLDIVLPENYQWPLVAEAELYEIQNSERVAIASWFAGNEFDPFVKPQWQGLFFMGRHIIDGYTPKPGAKYEYILKFHNPYDDYMSLVNNMSMITIDLTGIQGMPGRDPIRPLNQINTLKGFFSLPVMPGLTGGNILSDLEKVKQALRALFTQMNFPPMYEQVCGPDSCVKTMDTGVVATVGMRFVYQKQSLENISYFRESTIMSSYQQPIKQMPQIKCP